MDKYHLKFNHVGFRLVKAALEAEGLPWEKHDSFCETCALTRTKSHNHLDSKHSKEDCFPGEYLVCDAIGPLAKSPGGKKYWLFLRDKKSGYTMSFVVSSKAEFGKCVLMGLKKFSAHSGRKVKEVRMDGDGPFVSTELGEKIFESGTVPTWSSPYDHQQNGLAEGNVNTKFKDACAAMKGAGAPSFVWPAVVDYVDTTRNWLRSVKTEEGFITPSMSL